MPGIESEFVSYEYDTSLILTPENINRNATIVSATNPFKMRIQKKKPSKKCDILLESYGIQKSQRMLNYFNFGFLFFNHDLVPARK